MEQGCLQEPNALVMLPHGLALFVTLPPLAFLESPDLAISVKEKPCGTGDARATAKRVKAKNEERMMSDDKRQEIEVGRLGNT